MKGLETDTQEQVQKLYNQFEPKGSGPLSLMKIVRHLLLEIAKLKGFKIDE